MVGARVYIGLEGNGGVKRKGTSDCKRRYDEHLALSHNSITFNCVYRISNPLFSSFLHHHCLQILHTAHFLSRVTLTHIPLIVWFSAFVH